MASKNKWFKHYNTASSKGTLRALVVDGHLDVVVLYWRLLEYLSENEDENNRGHAHIPRNLFKAEFNWNYQRSSKLLLKIASTFKVELKTNLDESWEVFIPNWLELQEHRGGKRIAKNEQSADRGKKREVRGKRAEQSDDCYTAIPELKELEETFLTRKVTTEVQRLWATTYKEPAWLIEQVKKAIIWESANPKRRKKNFAAFMSNWLSRGKDEIKPSLSSSGIRIKSVAEVMEELNVRTT